MSLRERLSPLGNMHNSGGGVLDRSLAVVRRPLDRMYLRDVQMLGTLQELGADVEAKAPPATGPRVLVTTLRYWPEHAAVESVLALALRMRGAHVTQLICGGGQPACEVGRARLAEPRPCDRCAHHALSVNDATRLPLERLADHLPWGDSASDAPLDVPGRERAERIADVSVPWILKVADRTGVPGADEVVRDFGVSVTGVLEAAERILDEVQPDIVLVLNGLFAGERALAEVARARGLQVTSYEFAPRYGALVVSHGEPAPEMDTTAAWAAVRDRPLTPEQDAALEEMLRGRVAGTAAEQYFENPEADHAALRAQLDLGDKRVVSLFTNLVWDSACLHHDVAYKDMFDWMAGAVRAVEGLDDTVLVVRVHPAEIRWGTHERAADGLLARVGTLPANVRIVGPDQALSSYEIVNLSDLVLVYTTTLGLEAALQGRRTAVAGRMHYRGRGFTIDLESHDDLVAAVRAPAGPLPPEQLELARRYAFTFFYRTMVPFEPVKFLGGRVLRMPSRAEQLVGDDAHLDWVADRILDGRDFTLPDELAL